MTSRLIRMSLALLVFQAMVAVRSREASEFPRGDRVASLLGHGSPRPSSRCRLVAALNLVELGDQVADDNDGTEDEVRSEAQPPDPAPAIPAPAPIPAPGDDRLRIDPRLRAQKLRC